VFSHIGGHPVIDFVNTVGWRLDPQRRTEGLHSFADVVAWCCEVGLVAEPEAEKLYGHQRRRLRIAEEEWRSVLRLRDHVYDVVVGGDEVSAEVVAAEYRQAVEHARLFRAGGGSWIWGDSDLSLATPRRRIARSAVALLGQSEVVRVHQCEDQACGWVFIDTSPRQNRRWCVSADCGNRNRVRLHYQRRAQSPLQPPPTNAGRRAD